MFSKLGNFASTIFTLMFLGVLLGSVAVLYIVFQYSKDLPDYSQLESYTPPTVTRLYAADGQLIEEYATEKRLFVPINAIPKRLVNAFIAAEDKNFYSHPGIDFISIIRAAVKNIANIGKNRSLVGGSTITQQVVKNFLLTNEKSFSRKIKEAILAFRITQAYPKDKIMELYLNEIYLGNRSYGVSAAALNYFNKSIDELTIEEAATLASLPKAPSSLDPTRFPEKARIRRDWVISRMLDEGFINEVEAVLASSKDIETIDADETEQVKNAGFFAESVRQNLTEIYSEEAVYEKGMTVHTTLDPQLQNYAAKALRNGLLSYNKRHGWRGAIDQIEELENWQEELAKINKPAALGNWNLAVVLSVKPEIAVIGLDNSSDGAIKLDNIKWARKYIGDNEKGEEVTKISDVLSKGDVIAVSKLKKDSKEYALQQIPEINGAIVAIDPHTGYVLAMVGGYSDNASKFNRAIQAKRQPGSAFKPFVYLAALENGFTPNSIIIDEEVQLDMGHDMPGWRPQNYSGEYYGPTTLRVGLEKSRNAMTVRLSQLMGIGKVVDVAKRFNISKNPDRNFSVALGSAETNLLDLTNAYAMLVNGGKKVDPHMIKRIQDRNGINIYKSDERECAKCLIQDDTSIEDLQTPPLLTDQRVSVTDPIAAFQMVSLLEGVVQRGTGRRLKGLDKTLGGKTGTTNDSFDAWFMGFNPDLAIGVYVGFDTPRSLGRHETGASAALPIWKEFAAHALKNRPDIPFRRPSGIKMVKIDAQTGLLPSPDTPKDRIIYEAFKAGTEPTSAASSYKPANNNESEEELIEDFGRGGIY